MRLAALGEIALVIFFRAPKLRRRLDLRHDRPRKPAALVDLVLGCFRHGFLFGRMIENHGAILRADIGALAIQCRWIVFRPENIEQIFVTDLRGIEFHLDDFGVTGFVAANVLVSRIILFSAGIANGCSSHAGQIPESFFHTPKTACAKRRLLRCHSATMERLRAARNPRPKLTNVPVEACFLPQIGNMLSPPDA